MQLQDRQRVLKARRAEIRSLIDSVPGEGEHFVYHHHWNGTVFYVGKGRWRRPFMQRGRNLKWHEIVKEYGNFTVRIEGRFVSDRLARDKEAADIKRLRPAANIAQPRAIRLPTLAAVSEGDVARLLSLEQRTGKSAEEFVALAIKMALNLREMTRFLEYDE